MADRHREAFIRDDGHRLTKNGRSVVVGSLSFGRILTPEQNSALTQAVGTYLGAVSGLPPLATNHPLEINPAGIAAISAGPIYKYVPDEIWERYGRRGCFQLGSAPYYKSHENPNIRDVLEGSSFFHLVDGIDQLNCAIVSGFNCAIFCGTSVPDHDEDRNMTKMMLRRVNKTFFDEFYETALIPSLFAKPYRYHPERERRVVFELREDLRQPTIIVEDPALLEHVELMS